LECPVAPSCDTRHTAGRLLWHNDVPRTYRWGAGYPGALLRGVRKKP
jgi:hypothetical protein